MKKKKLLFIVLSICTTLAAYTEADYYNDIDDDEDNEVPVIPVYATTPARPITPPLISTILRFKFPQSIKKIPPLCGYYKGYRLRFNTDFCLINEKTQSDSFTLVIADDINRKWQNNTTKDLKRSGQKCRMFYISKRHDGSPYAWDVEEEKPSNIPQVLPKTCIVIIFDPDLISSLKKDDDLTKIRTAARNPLYLPIIEVSPEITQEKVKDICTETWCAAVDTRGIHSPVSSTVKNDQTMIIAMNTLDR